MRTTSLTCLFLALLAFSPSAKAGHNDNNSCNGRGQSERAYCDCGGGVSGHPSDRRHYHDHGHSNANGYGHDRHHQGAVQIYNPNHEDVQVFVEGRLLGLVPAHQTIKFGVRSGDVHVQAQWVSRRGNLVIPLGRKHVQVNSNRVAYVTLPFADKGAIAVRNDSHRAVDVFVSGHFLGHVNAESRGLFAARRGGNHVEVRSERGRVILHDTVFVQALQVARLRIDDHHDRHSDGYGRGNDRGNDYGRGNDRYNDRGRMGQLTVTNNSRVDMAIYVNSTFLGWVQPNNRGVFRNLSSGTVQVTAVSQRNGQWVETRQHVQIDPYSGGSWVIQGRQDNNGYGGERYGDRGNERYGDNSAHRGGRGR